MVISAGRQQLVGRMRGTSGVLVISGFDLGAGYLVCSVCENFVRLDRKSVV